MRKVWRLFYKQKDGKEELVNTKWNAMLQNSKVVWNNSKSKNQIKFLGEPLLKLSDLTAVIGENDMDGGNLEFPKTNASGNGDFLEVLKKCIDVTQ